MSGQQSLSHRIYHITAIDNLPSIIQCGGLHCDSAVVDLSLSPRGIAHDHIKQRRARAMVPLEPFGVLADYVPFYFTPRTPMLYAIFKGVVTGYAGGQRRVACLVTSAEAASEAGLPFVFTDGHAIITGLSQFYRTLEHLDKLDWEVIRARYWLDDTDQDPDCRRRRQAEFLVHRFFPWELIHGIAVYQTSAGDEVNEALIQASGRPPVRVMRDWFF